MELTNQNREYLSHNMQEIEYRFLIMRTFPELNTAQLQTDIPTLAKLVAIHIFTEEDSFEDDKSFETTQAKILTKNILKNLQRDGVHGLL